MKFTFLICILHIFPLLLSQEIPNTIRIAFVSKLENEPLQLNNIYLWPSPKDSLQITRLRFYISNIRLKTNGHEIYRDKKIRLIDMENPGSEKINIPAAIKTIDEISFDLGTDSLTNVSGVMGGDLDPTRGMYWAWHSGYINFKIEGKSSLCKNEEQNFQLHLGGYQHPFKTVKTIHQKISPASEIKVEIDLSFFLQSVDLSSTNQVMSPGKTAVQLSDHLSKSIRVK